MWHFRRAWVPQHNIRSSYIRPEGPSQFSDPFLGLRQSSRLMSSQSRLSTSSRPPDGNTASALAHGPSAPRRDHTRPINIPERRLWSHDRPKFYIQDSSGSSQGGSSTKSSGGSSTTSEGREGRQVHTVSPYGSFFVGDMDFDSPPDGSSHSRGGGWTTRRGTAVDINRVLLQNSARRSPSSQNGLPRRQSPTAPSPFETAESATYIGMRGALPVPGRNAPNEWEGTSSTLTANTHRSQSNHFTSWNRGYRNGSTNNLHNQTHNSQARQTQAVTRTALPPGSLSIPDRQKTRGVTRTTWRK